MPVIIGTAGHIDHGKTSLVKALTGTDTDRLKEEQERGISIELGFAHLDLPGGVRAGVVDVPGHERFIRTMVAGAQGFDLVLVAVAADDGVMPQTVEHLEILHLLGVAHAVFVITKIDLAGEARIAGVEAAVRSLAAGTALADAPMVRCSCATGEGLDRLRAAIAAGLDRMTPPPRPGPFRVPVDRVFTLRGHGLVATGTALQGEIRVGDRVRALPGGHLFRVRSLQVHGDAVESARWSQRVALNLTAAERQPLERGDMLCDERLTLVSDRFDARLEVRPSAPAGLASHQNIRVHLGTAERLGRLIVLGDGDLAPGGSGFCQIALRAPLHALRGDRFIVRDETAQRTLGGGVILHPLARAHRRDEPALLETLEALHTGDRTRVAEVLLDQQADFTAGRAHLAQLLNADEAALDGLREASALRTIQLDDDEQLATERKWRAQVDALLGLLREFHRTRPLEPGREMEEIREKLPHPAPAKVFRALVDRLAADGVVARDGSRLRLPGHAVSLGTEEQRAADQIRSALARSPLSPPDVPQMARETGMDRTTLVQVCRVLEREGSIVRVAPDLYLLRDALDGVARTLREQLAEGDEITPASFRERFQTSRKYAIPVLERLDVEGVTVRVGDRRRLKPSPAPRAPGPSDS